MMASTRNRKKNFLKSEVKSLLENFDARKDVLLCKYNSSVNKRQKREAWQEITNILNSENGEICRTMEEVRHKWKDLLLRAKREIGEWQCFKDTVSLDDHVSVCSKKILDIYGRDYFFYPEGEIVMPLTSITPNMVTIKVEENPLFIPDKPDVIIDDVIRNRGGSSDSDRNCASTNTVVYTDSSKDSKTVGHSEPPAVYTNQEISGSTTSDYVSDNRGQQSEPIPSVAPPTSLLHPPYPEYLEDEDDSLSQFSQGASFDHPTTLSVGTLQKQLLLRENNKLVLEMKKLNEERENIAIERSNLLLSRRKLELEIRLLEQQLK